DRELSLPSSIESLVMGVLGLDQEQSLITPAIVRPQKDNGTTNTASSAKAGPRTVAPPDGFRNAPPCSLFWAQKVDNTDPAYGGGFPSPSPYAPCGWKPSQLRDAYTMDSDVNK